MRVRQRKLGAWFDHHSGELDKQVPSWGGSLFVHALILLMLALYLVMSSGRKSDNTIQGKIGQLTESIDSAVDSDHAGDPWTKMKSDEPPSLSLEPAPKDVTKLTLPEIPNLSKFGPELTAPEFAPERAATSLPLTNNPNPKSKLFRADPTGAKGMAGLITTVHTEDITAPFMGRGEAVKARLVRREGGTVKSEKAVQDGLEWLVRHQRDDGGWSLDFHGQCQGAGCPPQFTIESDAAATGLALLPLLGAGHIHTVKSRYQANVRQAVDWLVTHQSASGDLYVGQGGMPHMYSHAIATMALCEAFGLSGDPRLRQPAQRAIDFIAQSQNHDDGGWRYEPGQAGDTSVFGWHMFALRSAKLAGLQVSKNVIKGCRTYLDEAAADKSKVTYSYMPGRDPTPVMTAEALLSRQYLGWPRDFPALVKGASRVAANLEESGERNIYYWYYATQLLHNMQNKDWERWNVRVREGLIAMQVTGNGCDRGSWDPVSPQPDRWARSGGRLFLTSLSVLTLEVYYRYLPLYNPNDVDMLKGEAEKDNKAKEKP